MKQCLFCGNIYLDEFDKCPDCARASYKFLEEQIQKQEEVQQEIDLTKIPEVKNPSPFLILVIIVCVFLALSSLCFII